MDKSPAVVIVARHGARLDAADPQWHLTSPTPYDSPLTYGGWKQAQTLGARIANILKVREDAVDDSFGRLSGLANDTHTSPNVRKRKRRTHRVVIHSSPFLRCVQTSIGISAGMAQWKGKTEAERQEHTNTNHTLHSGRPHIQRIDQPDSPHLSAIPEPNERESQSKHRKSSNNSKQDVQDETVLRLDACLGEWLSPDYFENITPPPGPKMMLASAKADLLRRGDPIEAFNQASGIVDQGNFPGGWSSNNAELRKPAMSSLDSMSKLGAVLPKISRANSHSVTASAKPGFRSLASRPHSDLNGQNAYVAPTPTYAVSPAQPIPQGYVNHARDACVKVDYQWDSMRPPLEWGNGGEYGEEWSAMHRRFRKGLDNMITWYRHHDIIEEASDTDGDTDELQHARTLTDRTEANDTDIVLILVTHGAGCNALIGALTNQPVLLDVGMASITMAVRRSVDYRRLPQVESRDSSPGRRRRSSLDSGISEEYDVQLTASTDHLRPGIKFIGSPSVRPRTPSLPVRDKSPYRYERHVGSPTHPNRSSPPANGRRRQTTLKEEGSFEEKATADATLILPNGGGLWSKPVVKPMEKTPPVNDARISISQADGPKEARLAKPSGLKSDPVPHSQSPMTVNGAHEKSLAQHGLWGAQPKAIGAERDRTKPKRRWTSTEA